ncbi:MAG: 50S ribosomal protein L22 [Candidatus Magasanikbacteria bacterium RIFOXYA2_FULL_44_8]|uniref:Large ribosomal subunit protein uL22 n=1 Tax=Candidatus Magasanikbacteria bacterium RIFOXYA2_FULL_44_8 TaxID=1798696 RepID=A0A1F6NK22_9BACT|nr:MAG: 50S ribosomal protein L22 [Candidatus Magasanikbacteria bacterium RIFOXYA2_FULL_44_8]
MKEVTAKLSYLKIGPRKVRLVVDLIRGRSVVRAQNTLSLLNKLAAKPVLKLLNSAVANAKHNFQIEKDNLRVAKITVDGGPVLKRWMPKAHGRATPIRERTSHINLTLVEMPPIVKKVKKDDKKSDKK